MQTRCTARAAKSSTMYNCIFVEVDLVRKHFLRMTVYMPYNKAVIFSIFLKQASPVISDQDVVSAVSVSRKGLHCQVMLFRGL